VKRVLVVGGGVAGAAAAWRASTRGLHATWVKGRAGASALGSGAADLQPWTVATPDEPVSAELVSFVRAFGAWTLEGRSARVMSAAGVVRQARARDAWVLDLAPHAGACIGIVTPSRSTVGVGVTFGPALLESAWTRATGTRVFDLVVRSEGRGVRDGVPELDTLYAHLIAAPTTPDAWLLPASWLVDDTRHAELERRLARCVGCPLTGIGGILGARLGRLLDDFAPSGVERVAGSVTAIEAGASGGVAGIADGEGRESVPFDALVLCVGGLAGGGIVQDERGALRLSVQLLDVEFEARVGTRVVRLDAASPGGIDFCALGHNAILEVGVRHRSSRLSPTLFVAGDAASGVPRTLLGAAQSAVDAVDAILG
jgi:hypothetical protein